MIHGLVIADAEDEVEPQQAGHADSESSSMIQRNVLATKIHEATRGDSDSPVHPKVGSLVRITHEHQIDELLLPQSP